MNRPPVDLVTVALVALLGLLILGVSL